MKRAHAILLAAVAVGCGPKAEGSSDSGETTGDGDVAAACVEAGWTTSFDAYAALAEQADNTYWYSIFTYEFIGDFEPSCIYRTTIEVVGDTPVRRELELDHVDENTLPEDCTFMPFVEEGEAVGSMTGGVAVPAYTMEQLYAGCCELLALEPMEMYSDHFEVDADGVVASCFTIENGCGEGCEASVDGFPGFTLAEFEFGARP